MRRGPALAVAAFLAAAAGAQAGPPRFALPIDCRPGESCFIQQYPDHDPGPGAQDWTCGPLSYDGHDGTDFALPSRLAMEEGVAVLAAAPGTVAALRDGMEDTPVDAHDAPDITGRECGNAVLLDHGFGWQTLYCHLRRGSVAVRRGQRVAAGERLGLVGLSGATAFPHLHFEVRRNGRAVDPFLPGGGACGSGGPTLWAETPDYLPGGLIAAGIAPFLPAYADVKAGLPAPLRLPPDTPALVLWAYAFGGRAGDVLRFRLAGPAGPLLEQSMALDRPLAQYFRAAGRRRPGPEPWPTGIYAGDVTLLREGEEIGRAAFEVAVVD